MRAPTDRRPSFGAAPLLVALFIQGMPLTLTIGPPERRWAEELHQLTLDRVTTLGFESAWAPALAWALLYVLSAIALWTGPRHRVRVTVLLNILGILALVGASALWSEYPNKVWMSGAHAVGTALIAAAAAAHYRDDVPSAVRHVALVFGANVAVHLCAVAIAPGVTIDVGGRWTGLTQHPNVLGAIAFACAWANVAALRVCRTKGAWWHVAATGAAVLALAGTQSVTSVVAAVVSVVAILWLGALDRLRAGGTRLPGILPAIAAGAACIAVPLVFSWADVAGWFGRSSDISGRLWLWNLALELVQQKPLLGWGFDDNATVIALTELPYTHFHNGLLDLAVRGGLVAVGLVAVLLAAALRDLTDAQRRTGAGYVFVALIIGVLVHNATEVSLITTRNLLWLLLLFVAFWAGGAHGEPSAPRRRLLPRPANFGLRAVLPRRSQT